MKINLFQKQYEITSSNRNLETVGDSHLKTNMYKHIIKIRNNTIYANGYCCKAMNNLSIKPRLKIALRLIFKKL
jgi:hypothetical protein